VALRPCGDVAALDGGGHQVTEGVGGAGEGGDAEAGQGGGVLTVVTGCPIVGQREQGDRISSSAASATSPSASGGPSISTTSGRCSARAARTDRADPGP